jgi:hypothetical protein
MLRLLFSSGRRFSLLLNDGRVAVVNCTSKVNRTEWARGPRRDCRIPIVNETEVEFSGANADTVHLTIRIRLAKSIRRVRWRLRGRSE